MNIRSLSAPVLAVLASAAIFATPALADCKLAECGFDIGTASAFNVSSMHGMEGGRWIVEAAPGVWSMATGRGGSDPHGYTAGFSVKREFSPSWGAGVIASTARQSGSVNITKTSNLLGDNGSFSADPGGTVSGIGGTIVGAMATHDFHPNPESWRLPFSFGALYTWRSVKFNHDYTNALGQHEVDSVDFTKASLGLFANVSVDVTIHKDFVIMPGAFLAKGMTNMTSGATFSPDYVVTKNGVTTHYQQSLSITDAAAVLYTSFLYRPMGLSFDWNMTQLLLGKNTTASSIYSLKWSKKFG